MDNIYLILVVVLFALAISDLIVGVSNDAVNFLNSAIGSKVAPLYVIMIIASIGIFVGATFSSGMMEVARKGIFYPQNLFFSEVMIIFLAVMITDILLLDFFNTLGLPTSTTVSIVFELLGAAVAIGFIKIYNTGGVMTDYVNAANALAIISGILVSIVVAFTAGTIIQFFTRLLFSFHYEKYIKYFGALWGAIALSSITYFILIKGVKGSSFISEETLDWIKNNTLYLFILSFVAWAVIFQFILWFTKINILKITVLAGTFALAMAFAGNDLVNFIGVPLAGFKSFQIFCETPGADASQFLMTALAGKVKTETYLLLISGLIMVLTLWFSRKARSVAETQINLSRQDEGYERFGSSRFSRDIVRGSIVLSNSIKSFIPSGILSRTEKRFDQSASKKNSNTQDHSAFDLIRASVNLTVASILISFATSLKLPLSTTYVTFMVAMGSSFADGAWGRESAVYRISGVMTVIGGWFFTAIVAFTVSLTFAFIIYYGGIIAIASLMVIAILFIFKTHVFHSKQQQKQKTEEIEESEEDVNVSVLQKTKNNIVNTIQIVSPAYNDTIYGLIKGNRSKLKETKKEIENLNNKVKHLKTKIHHTIEKLKADDIESGHFYVQMLDYLREMAHCLTFIINPVYEHVNNNHKSLLPTQGGDFKKINSKIYHLFNSILEIINESKFSQIEDVIAEQQELLAFIKELNKKQIKRIKNDEAGTRNSMLYMNILSETKNLLLHAVNVTKAYRDFFAYTKDIVTAKKL